MTNEKAQFEKDRTAIKNYLLGCGYTQALKAMAFAEKFHIGFRKDNVTPEFHHQIRIAFSVLNLRDVENEETCLILSFLHDTKEDYKISQDQLTSLFGSKISSKCSILDKNCFIGEGDCFTAIGEDIDCSIVKGADNCDNIQSMHGAFTDAKIAIYCERTERYVLPMLKIASRNFPHQSFSYSALRNQLKNKIVLYRELIKLSESYKTKFKEA